MTQQRKKSVIMIFFVGLFLCLCYYNILFDILCITALFICSYFLGYILKAEGSYFEKMIMRSAAGMGIIGIIIYFILLVGFGSKSVYIAVLILCLTVSMPFLIKKKQEFLETAFYVKDNIISHWFVICVLMLVLTWYLAYGSAPIGGADPMAKHLPITIYAAENGKWYTNVTESIVYGEAMVLQYTYSVLFYSLGAYKALVLFNVVLFFTVYIILAHFIRCVYAKSNIWILAIILFSTPLFLGFSTVFYLEILPLFFLFSAFVGLGKIQKQNIWYNIELISFLCGCAIFAKLTVAFTMAVMALVLIVECIKYALEKKVIKQAIVKMIRSILAVVAPCTVSIFHIWYMVGNPLFPTYNGIFRSPYFVCENFQDPFTNKLSFSIQSLIDIVFRTTLNIEMYPGGMGIFLLFVFTIPLALGILFIKKEIKDYSEYIIWSLIAMVSYRANAITTYNLRYYFSTWVLLACVITIGISICVAWVAHKSIEGILLAAVGAIIIYPNLLWLKKYDTISLKLVKDERIVQHDYCEIIDIIPEGKRVLAITNSFLNKGSYYGYFATTTWHNNTLYEIFRNETSNGGYTWEEYLSSFDYIIVDKVMEEPLGLAAEAMEKLPDFIERKCYENSICEIYEVAPKLNEILEAKFDTLQQINGMESLTDVFQNIQTDYYITCQIYNETDHPISVSFQINWMSERDEFLDCYTSSYDVQPGKNEYSSEKISANLDAAYGTIYIMTADGQEVGISGYSLEGINNVVVRKTVDFENRSRLRYGNSSTPEEEYVYD